MFAYVCPTEAPKKLRCIPNDALEYSGIEPLTFSKIVCVCCHSTCEADALPLSLIEMVRVDTRLSGSIDLPIPQVS